MENPNASFEVTLIIVSSAGLDLENANASFKVTFKIVRKRTSVLMTKLEIRALKTVKDQKDHIVLLAPPHIGKITYS